jgi:hypothetical protein
MIVDADILLGMYKSVTMCQRETVRPLLFYQSKIKIRSISNYLRSFFHYDFIRRSAGAAWARSSLCSLYLAHTEGTFGNSEDF